MISGTIWRIYKVLRKIKSANCHHYYRYDGTKSTLFLRRTLHCIECEDCGKLEKFTDEKEAIHKINKSQNSHGVNYRKLRNSLYEGSIDLVKMDFRN